MFQLYDVSWAKLLLHFPFLTFQGRACFMPCAFVDVIPSAWLAFLPFYFPLLKYYLKALLQMANPLKLSKTSLFCSPIILCTKLHFNTDCSCLILFAGTILNSHYFFSKCLVFLIGVNTSMYKWPSVHLQINPRSKCISVA